MNKSLVLVRVMLGFAIGMVLTAGTDMWPYVSIAWLVSALAWSIVFGIERGNRL